MKYRRASLSLLVALNVASCRHTADPAEGTRAAASVASAAASVVSTAPLPSGSAAPAEPPADQSAVVEERLRMMGLEPAEVARFLAALQASVASSDRAAVCALASYPLRVNLTASSRKVTDEAACRRQYEQIFTPRVTAAIGKQQLANLHVTSKGVMIGDGEVWFAGICGDAGCKQVTLLLTAINT